MKTSHLVFAAFIAAILINHFICKDFEVLPASAILIALSGSMIFFNRFWTDHILTFGFWESMASDFKRSGDSASAVVFIGWLGLAAYTFLKYYRMVE